MCSRWPRPCGSVRPQQPSEVRTFTLAVVRSWPRPVHCKRQSWDQNPGLIPAPALSRPHPSLRSGGGRAARAQARPVGLQTVLPAAAISLAQEARSCCLSKLLGSHLCLGLERSRAKGPPHRGFTGCAATPPAGSFQSVLGYGLRWAQLLEGGSKP